MSRDNQFLLDKLLEVLRQIEPLLPKPPEAL